MRGSQRQEWQELMVDVVRRRGSRTRGRAAERAQPLGAVAAQYAAMGWPVCPGAHPYRGTRASMEPGRACSCDRVGCPAPGAHPVSPAWQMQATVDLKMIESWWETRPEANVILVTGRVFDVLDVPAAAGALALERMEAVGAPVGPVALPGQDRMLFFVVTRGSPADEDEWWSCGLDCEPESVGTTACGGTAATATCSPRRRVTPMARPRAGSARHRSTRCRTRCGRWSTWSMPARLSLKR